MKRTALLIMWIFVLAALLATGSAQAKDWAEWRGANRDGISQETGLLSAWPATGPKVLWEAKVGQGFSCMAVAGERVLTIGDQDGAQWLYAFDVSSGKELYKVRLGDKFKGGGFPGPRSTPTIDGDRVYATSGESNLVCIEVATGKTLWQKNLIKEFAAKSLTWGTATSPLVHGKYLYVNVGASKGASIVAFDKRSGNVIWKALNDIAGYSSPLFATISGQPQLVVFLGTAVVGITPDSGKELWRYPWKTSYDVHAATPIVDGNKVFITSGYNVGCALIEINLKAAPPVKEIWKSKIIRGKFATPVLLKGYLYGFDESTLRCVNFATGESKWETNDYGMGSLVVAGGLGYVLGEKGSLTLARLTPEKFEKISECKTSLGLRCWTMPVVANGRLYVRDETKLLCLDVKAK